MRISLTLPPMIQSTEHFGEFSLLKLRMVENQFSFIFIDSDAEASSLIFKCIPSPASVAAAGFESMNIKIDTRQGYIRALGCMRQPNDDFQFLFQFMDGGDDHTAKSGCSSWIYRTQRALNTLQTRIIIRKALEQRHRIFEQAVPIAECDHSPDG